jgi:hypothetical protein
MEGWEFIDQRWQYINVDDIEHIPDSDKLQLYRFKQYLE